MVADYGEACRTESVSVVGQHICEAPVHLVCLTGRYGVTTETVPMGSNLWPFGRDEMLMSGDVPFHCAAASGKTNLL